MTDAQSRRQRRDQRQQVTPGPQKATTPRRPMWQTALIGLAVLAGAFLIAFIVTGEGAPELTEAAPVEIVGDPLAPIPDPGADDPAVGQPAPEATGQNFQGEAVDLLADDGGTIVVFLAHWCPHCQREVPVLVDEWTDTLPPDVRVVAVPTSTDRTQGNYPPSAWLEAEDWPFDVLVDSSDDEIARAYGVQSFPAFVVVGPDGNVQVRASGELSPAGLDELVQAATGSSSE